MKFDNQFVFNQIMKEDTTSPTILMLFCASSRPYPSGVFKLKKPCVIISNSMAFASGAPTEMSWWRNL